MTINNGSASLPRWNFASIDTSIDTWKKEAGEILESFPALLDTGESHGDLFTENIIWLEKIIEKFDRLCGVLDQLDSYSYCRYSVETGNSEWIKLLNSIETLSIPLNGYQSRFVNILCRIFDKEKFPQNKQGVEMLLKKVDASSVLHNFAYYLEQSLEIAKYRMPPEMENLAGDLQRNAGDAWGRLQSSMLSKMATEWNMVSHETKTMVELRGLAHHEQRHIRKKAYALELKLWRENETVFAAALNGVKGNSLSLYERRGYKDFLHPSIQSSHISETTLNSLIAAMEESLPMFRRYFKAKAAHLGLPALSFYDMFAPIPGGVEPYSYTEAQEYIISQFKGFSQGLGNFAHRAFTENWVDAEPRSEKVGGAYMTDFPLSEESRIMSNFDGTFNAVSTLAHELGHAYHSEMLKGFKYLNRIYPMTLAETASTFCETIVYNAAIDKASTGEKNALIESLLMGTSQVIVDILSRFYFEKEVFARRKNGELSPNEFCELMLDAQKKTYADGLNENELHPYMWAVKGHYYNTDLAFYNYPYAFGQLFALGLYAQYEQDPKGFPESYNRILKNTGIMSAVELCAQEGFAIEEPQFWRDGLAMLEPLIQALETGQKAG